MLRKLTLALVAAASLGAAALAPTAASASRGKWLAFIIITTVITTTALALAS